jgi:general secretion pathway protein K
MAVADWLDADNYPEFPGGAEDETYSSLKLPYRTANHYIADISELMSIKGFDRKTYSILEPHISALPIDTAININTASSEVLMSIDEKFTQTQIGALIQQRESSPFESVSELYSLANQDPEEQNTKISTQTEYFLAEIEVKLHDRLYRRHTYLYRDLQTGSVSAFQRVHNPNSIKIEDNSENEDTPDQLQSNL